MPKQSLAETESSIVSFLVEHYHQCVQTATTKGTPHARWVEGHDGRLNRVVANERDLDILLPSGRRRILTSGLRMNGAIYQASELLRSNAVGDEVCVVYDPHDLSQVHVYKIGNREDDGYICSAKVVSPQVVKPNT